MLTADEGFKNNFAWTANKPENIPNIEDTCRKSLHNIQSSDRNYSEILLLYPQVHLEYIKRYTDLETLRVVSELHLLMSKRQIING